MKIEDHLDDRVQRYLTQQIIPYIGNKRKLLPLINSAIRYCNLEPSKSQFIDLFSGSGVVSRFAKTLNFQNIITNDWEYYSYCINQGYLGVNPSDLSNMFQDKGGLEQVLYDLNQTLEPLDKKERYLSVYYAPLTSSVYEVDFKTQRLFYTRENALFIDAVRGQIQKWYADTQDPLLLKEKYLLLSILLYLSATHSNTSGVFKAYHKGFGGYGKNALSRILKKIQMSVPVLYESSSYINIFQEDALLLAQQISYSPNSVAYLDPPYNQHQYGSNYHLLNSIAKWDCIEVSNELSQGVLKNKAGIRKDWKNTKSSFCYKQLAVNSFIQLVEAIRSRYILISYSSEGVIDFNLMKDFLSQQGKLSILTNQYIKYPGGRSSIFRLNRNIEYIFIVDRYYKSSKTDLRAIEQELINKKISLLLHKNCKRDKLMSIAYYDDIESSWNIEVSKYILKMKVHYNYTITYIDISSNMSLKAKKILLNKLEECICSSKVEELEEIYTRLVSTSCKAEKDFFLSKAINSLKNLAYKNTSQEFGYWCSQLESYADDTHPSFQKSFFRLKEIYSLRVGT